MKEPEWIVGIDLGSDQPQLSWFPLQSGGPDQAEIRDVESSLSFDADAYEHDGGPYLERFLRQLLEDCNIAGTVSYLSVTSREEEMQEALMTAAASIAGEGNCSFFSRILSYTWYALSRKPELWSHDNGLFEYDRKGLWYTQLEISSARKPVRVSWYREDLSSYMKEAGEEAGGRDACFARAVAHVGQGKSIATFYLTGSGFEGAYEGDRWMNASLKELCRTRRHVFVGQNLFARGACMAGYYARHPKASPGFIAMGMGLSVYDISLLVSQGGKTSLLPLVRAQQPFRSAAGSARIISCGAGYLQLAAHNVMTGEEKIFRMELGQIPGRPERTHRFELNLCFEEEGVCRLRASDTGFGSLYPSSGRVYEQTIHLEGPADTAALAPATPVRPAAPDGAPFLQMKLSGAAISSTDELSWYIYENIFMLDEDFFGEELYRWLDEKTGSSSLSGNLQRISQGGRQPVDGYRTMLTAFGFLDAREIQAVCASISQLQKVSPMEKARIRADGLCRYGKDLEALALYHHAAWLMDHEEILASDRSRAVIWHNMGVCLMRLHDAASAADCMRRACECDRNPEYLQAYLCVLYMAGQRSRMPAAAARQGFPEEEAEKAITLCENAIRGYDASGRGLGMRAGLSLKDLPGQTGYEDFVQEYIRTQCRRYGVQGRVL